MAAKTPVLDWRERLVCSRCGQVDMVVSGTVAPANSYALGRGGGSSITSGG
jgi:hypothetical protein